MPHGPAGQHQQHKKIAAQSSIDFPADSLYLGPSAATAVGGASAHTTVQETTTPGNDAVHTNHACSQAPIMLACI